MALVVLPKAPSTVKGSRNYIMTFFGEIGVGKTTFVDGLGRVLFLTTDRGTKFMSAMRYQIAKWEDVQNVAQTLKVGNNASFYDFVCFDLMQDVAIMAEDYMCEQLNVDALDELGWSKGYRALRRELFTVLATFMSLNIGVIFISHDNKKKIKVGGIERDQVMPEMTGTAWKIVGPICDIVGYCHVKATQKNIGGKTQTVRERVVQTQPTPNIFAKDRTLRKKPASGLEPLDGPAFAKTFVVQ